MPLDPLVSISTTVFASILKFLLGLPHATTVDDIYDDIFIPKGDHMMKSEVYLLTLLPLHMLGSTVVANIWLVHNLLSLQDLDTLF
jgi:hypothetical protein